MNKKEKAKELVDRFRGLVHSGVDDLEITLNENAKRCALICVEEKIKSLLPYAGFFDVKKDIEELEKVKQEIEKL